MTTAQWEEVKNRHDTIAQELTNPKLDSAKRHELQKEFSGLHALFSLYKEIQELEKEHADVLSQSAQTTEAEMKLLFDEELQTIDRTIVEKKRELEDLLYPPSPHDTRSVFLEIRAGTGGQEAALFASDLHTMYTNYAIKKGWKASVESSSTTDLGGFREIVMHIKGKQVFGHLKFESGVHRVQRVPSTETSGRIHTSTATVAVLPEAEEVDVSINPADLRIDVYRASGAGGQHVNTTDSAVRITHIPTGVVVACQDERSQHKNKAKAMKLLQSRILAAQIERQHEQMSKQRKELVGSGMRAEKVRTYNYPQNRVTDHQVNITLNKLDIVMQGDLDEIIQALLNKEHEDRRNLSPD